ncbi:MAG: RsmE family RNA methyltransferase, partial [Candidatus Krumholzibacteriia bacterium]
PVLGEPAPLLSVLAAARGEVLFGAAPGDLVGEAVQDATALAAQAARRRLAGQAAPAELLVLIGPEGGWSAAELHLFAGRGAVPLTLGPHVLRTETAALAGLVALQQVRRAWIRPA